MPNDFRPRKQPQQERSRLLRDRILEASLRVLRDEGALGFTTTRVADEAEVSVGSLYQYFPNKHALVMALHEDDIRQGIDHICEILNRTDWSPRRRLSEITQWFFASEAEEVSEFGAVLGDIEVFLRANSDDNVANRVQLNAARKQFEAFISTSSTRTWTPAELRFAARFTWATIETLGKSVGRETTISASANRRWATETADMLANHLQLDAADTGDAGG